MMIFTESHSHSLMIKRNAELTYICIQGTRPLIVWLLSRALYV